MGKLTVLYAFLVSISYGFSQIQQDTVVDIDGNVYHTVRIGTQTWMVENLKVTHFRNGDSIACLRKKEQWVSTVSPGYCDYDLSGFHLIPDQEKELRKLMGKLYNGFTILDSRNIAPQGWRVPKYEDIKILENFLGGSKIAGAKLKDTLHWSTRFMFNPYTLNTTNETGFTALPDGYRDEKGVFQRISEETRWWTKHQTTDLTWWVWSLINTRDPLFLIGGENLSGYSVRCVKDE
ncbi:fibrobacter succinogenes major paralogous domain-containing protein [Fluviicola chungangensis]|uniref:Fibrobacter succinogenes major paralogous domain-containing protein n=1 Tax=Fluviicola chungangensis TaxID=2597671 RepID=A0A556N6L4_9FLAO|nr:fibrobacter succinogenes major paralogous domain-containing protein [Fluviicola chungangensis]TSJ47785.1 hypothetical protein FO442_01260 [Fluviicola chungangensis]